MAHTERTDQPVQPAYQDRIITDPRILVGKPTVKGTRIPVELVLARLEADPDLAELFADYPELTVEDVKACLGYARTLVQGTRTRKAVNTSPAAPPAL